MPGEGVEVAKRLALPQVERAAQQPAAARHITGLPGDPGPAGQLPKEQQVKLVSAGG